MKHRVQKMTEAENEKMREAMRVRKEVTQENSHAHRSLNERQFRDRVKEQSEERERAILEMRAENEKEVQFAKERERALRKLGQDIEKLRIQRLNLEMTGSPSITGIGIELNPRESFISP